jgi:apolipoprotein N-acyltransferase
LGNSPPRVGRGALAAALVLLLPLAFPFRVGEFKIDAGLFFGWLVPVVFVGMVRGLTPRRAFLWGTASATLGYAAVLYWIYVVVHVHGHAAPVIAVLAVFGLALYVGIHLGLAAAFAAWALPTAGRLGAFLLASAWVVMEQLRTFDVASGFPWAFLGYSLHAFPAARELASAVGVYGLSFLLVLAATLVWTRGPARTVGLPALASLVVVGALASALGEDPAETGIGVGIVQGNIPQAEKWDPDRAQSAFDAHLDLSREAAGEGVQLVVWPEASVPVFLEVEPSYGEKIGALARQTEAVLLIGGLGVDRVPGEREVAFHNSVFVVGPSGEPLDRYDKSRLVPFGEYVPFRRLLGFLSGLATGIASGDITPGIGPRAVAVPGLGAEHALAPLICYEVIYPELVRRAVRAGARVLVNMTNDAWYGRTSAPDQFLAIATMRAAENGVPMVRAANTGISALVDARGAVQAETPIFERRTLVGSLPGAFAGATLYSSIGNWIVWLSWGILLLAGGKALVGRQRRSPGNGGSAPHASGTGGGASEASLTSTPNGSESRS